MSNVSPPTQAISTLRPDDSLMTVLLIRLSLPRSKIDQACSEEGETGCDPIWRRTSTRQLKSRKKPDICKTSGKPSSAARAAGGEDRKICCAAGFTAAFLRSSNVVNDKGTKLSCRLSYKHRKQCESEPYDDVTVRSPPGPKALHFANNNDEISTSQIRHRRLIWPQPTEKQKNLFIAQ